MTPPNDTHAPERIWLKPCDPCKAPDDYYVCDPLYLDGREVSYVKDEVRCRVCQGGLRRANGWMICVECGITDDFKSAISRPSLSAAREAAAAMAMRDECGDIVEREGHSLHRAVRNAVIPADAQAALDRLIAEARREAFEEAAQIVDCYEDDDAAYVIRARASKEVQS